MKNVKYFIGLLILIIGINVDGKCQTSPDEIKFTRQGVQRMIFNQDQSIPLARLEPENIIGMSAMHPVHHYSKEKANVYIQDENLIVHSPQESETGIWLGGFNPFATYSIDLNSISGEGEIGFEFSDAEKTKQFFVTLTFNAEFLTDVSIKVINNSEEIIDKSIAINLGNKEVVKDKIILQMLGSGLIFYMQDKGLPKPVGQCDFNNYFDLRRKQYVQSFQSGLYVHLKGGQIKIKKAESAFTPGIGLADMRAITYENGDPLLDNKRLWYTMSIRGRALPHHIQGVFSMDPTVFDIRLEGIIVFDRQDGLLRNEIASHIFYDRREKVWRGLTTGFSAYADPNEKKQLLAIESKIDPRFGFSIMKAEPFGMVGDIEDPHLLYDSEAEKWRMLACFNDNGYKAVMLESDYWNQEFERIAGPVEHNSTGTSIQRIGNERYCFSGSSERNIFIYTYPELKEIGTLQMDLPPWDETSGTRVWPNIIQLPEGYPLRYVALMMDRFNYPDLKGPHWSYGALYLYHGYE